MTQTPHLPGLELEGFFWIIETNYIENLVYLPYCAI